MGESLATIIAVPSRWPRYTILIGTPCCRNAIANGANMKVAGKRPDATDSFISGNPLNRTGSYKPSPPRFLLIQSVTGQVRCQVTGRKPTRNSSL